MIRTFNRYELKYIVHARDYHAIVKDLRHFLAPDPHGDADGFYRVVSLYYDSPDHSAYWSKVEGLKYRRKLRLRIYPGEDIRKVEVGFVEIKQRINRTVQKRRVILPLADARRLCTADEIDTRLDPGDARTASEIAYLVRAQQLRPQAVVSYRRRAYMGGRFERGMRLTFDMQLKGRIHALQVDEIANDRYFMPPDWMIMEVKVNERIPDWMIALLGKHECQLRRVSKYCAVVSHGRQRLERSFRHKENLYG